MPSWLHVLSIVVVLSGCASALLIAVDVVRHPQKMAIMNVVWPVTGLYGSVLAVWAYFEIGRAKTKPSFPVMVAKGSTHCGSGCCLGDLISEWLAFSVPAVAVWFGWKTLFSEKIFAVWILDYVLAFGLGVAFQYFTIKPMRNLSAGEGIVQAIKADAASLTAWQIGMYGFMALAQFYLLKGVRLEPNMFEFWFMMQIAMIAGFTTSYPVNWWLIKTGVKEKM